MRSTILPHYELWGHGPYPVLMIHGYMMRGEMYYPFIEPMGMDCQMLIPDLRGYGNSKSFPGPYTLRQMMYDMEATMNTCQWESAHVVGYSMGGVLAQMLAIHFPERIRSLTLCSTFAYKAFSTMERLQSQMTTTMIKRIGAKGIPRFVGQYTADMIGKMDRKTFEWYKAMLIDNRDDVLLYSANDLFKTDLRPHLKNISAPTLIFGTDSDVIVPIHHAYHLANNIPNAKLKIVPDAGHAVLHTHHHLFTKMVLKHIEQYEQKNQVQAS